MINSSRPTCKRPLEDGFKDIPMMKHYILNLNPTAKHEWDRFILRDPLNIQVTVLEEAAIPQNEQLSLPFPEVGITSQMREAA
jgi:hypothetical protein